MLWSTLDVLVEEYSNNGTTGRTRGLFLVVLNLGVLIAPFISTWLVQSSDNGFQLVFYLASLFVFIPMIILATSFSERRYLKRKVVSKRKFSLYRELLKRKDVLRIYVAAFLLDLFYSVMVVYTPVYLLKIGLSWLEIGKIFTVMLLPFVLIQYPLGVLADRKTGEKELLILALFVMALATGCIGLVEVPKTGIWMCILFLTRVGAATVEIMRDSYFYKQVEPTDIEIMDFFRTTKSTSYIVGMLIFSSVLAFSELKVIFLLLGLFLLLGTIPLFWLKDTEAINK